MAYAEPSLRFPHFLNGGGNPNGGVTHVDGYTIPCLFPLSNHTLALSTFPFHGRKSCVGFLPTSTGSDGYVANCPAAGSDQSF